MTGQQLNTTVNDMVDPIKSNRAADYERIRELKIPFIGQRITSWKSAADSIERSNKSKAFFLRAAHIVLLAAMILVCVLTWGILSGGLKTTT
jgi:hypothetical protein